MPSDTPIATAPAAEAFNNARRESASGKPTSDSVIDECLLAA